MVVGVLVDCFDGLTKETCVRAATLRLYVDGIGLLVSDVNNGW